MTKLEVFIDFEGISSPFNYDLGFREDIPYAYSIGIFVGKKFKTKTFVFNFTKDSIHNVYDIMRSQINKDLKFLRKKNFNITKLNTIFVAYSPYYEKKVLSKVFKGVSVMDISFGKNISLNNATNNFIKDDQYFKNFKKWVTNNIDPDFIKKRGLENDGALASFVGHILLADALNKKTKYYQKKYNISSLIKELFVYSKDDVVRMSYIKNNIPLFMQRADKVQAILKEKAIARKKQKHLNAIELFLKNNDFKDLDQLKKELEKQLKESNKTLELSHKL